MGTQTSKNKPIPTIKNAKIQSRMVRKKIHTNTIGSTHPQKHATFADIKITT